MKIIGCQGPISASSIQTQISEVDGSVDALRERNEVNFLHVRRSSRVRDGATQNVRKLRLGADELRSSLKTGPTPKQTLPYPDPRQ